MPPPVVAVLPLIVELVIVIVGASTILIASMPPPSLFGTSFPEMVQPRSVAVPPFTARPPPLCWQALSAIVLSTACRVVRTL